MKVPRKFDSFDILDLLNPAIPTSTQWKTRMHRLKAKKKGERDFNRVGMASGRRRDSKERET